IWRLIDKGYAQELSSYPALQAEISRMNPKVQQAITHNGQFSALPISLFFDSWLLRPDLLQEAGYDHPPATLCEYFEMLGEWEANQSTEFDFAFHLTPSSDFGLKRYPCIRMAVDAYIAQYEQPNSPLSFDSEVFRQVLCAIEALHYPAENVDHALSQSPLFSRFTKPPEAIFTLNEWNPLRIGVFSEHPEQLIARPPFEIGQAPRSNASMYLAIINPKSLSKQNAADFLAYMAQHQAPDNLVALYPNANEAIEHAPTVASLKQQQQELATLRELQLVADEAHQANISDAIAQMEQNFARFEKNRFSITAESIAAYRQVEPAMYIPRDSLYWNLLPAQRDDFDEILKRYAAGALDAEGLISQLDQKMQLMFLEQ
ncbi:MAG: hypothetical protein RR824_12020, partial [Clostridia bacterium]